MRILMTPNPTDGTGLPTEKPTSEKTPPVNDGTEGFRLALAKHSNDTASLARDAFQRNQALEEKIRDLESRLPKAGSIVLDVGSASDLEAFRALGKPEDLKTALDRATENETWRTARERSDVLHSAAKVAGFDPDVLATLVGSLRIEVRKVKDKTGKDCDVAEVVEVVTVNGKQEERRTTLDKYAESTWPKFLPSLRQPSSLKPTAPPERDMPRTYVSKQPGRMEVKLPRM